MKSVGIYLTFDGNCAEVFDFYKGIFGGEFGWKATFGESPLKEKTPAEAHDRIMHVSLPIGKKFDLMGCDRNPEMHKKKHSLGTNTEITLTPENKEEADRLYEALAKDGSADQPLKDQFWGSYFGCCTDKFGTQWMIDTPTPSLDGKRELQEAAKALRLAAEIASKQAEMLEKMYLGPLEPHAKKVKIDKEFETA